MAKTAKQNGWFSKAPQKKGSVRRSSMTVGEAVRTARSAGAKSGDTGEFEGWLSSKGLQDRGRVVIDRLKNEYRYGVEHGASGTSGAKVESSPSVYKTYRGVEIYKDAEKQFFTSLEPESKFDGLKEAKEFIDEQKKQRNPVAWGIFRQERNGSWTRIDYTSYPSKQAAEAKIKKQFAGVRGTIPAKARPLVEEVKNCSRNGQQTNVNISALIPLHEVRMGDYKDDLVKWLIEYGWKGAPFLGIAMGSKVQLLTGSHRYGALKALEHRGEWPKNLPRNEAPVYVLSEKDFNIAKEGIKEGFQGSDNDRLRFLKKHCSDPTAVQIIQDEVDMNKLSLSDVETCKRVQAHYNPSQDSAASDAAWRRASELGISDALNDQKERSSESLYHQLQLKRYEGSEYEGYIKSQADAGYLAGKNSVKKFEVVASTKKDSEHLKSSLKSNGHNVISVRSEKSPRGTKIFVITATTTKRELPYGARVVNPAKFEHCVEDVRKKSKGTVNEYAVCTSAGTRNPKSLSEMTAGEINKALDKIDSEGSKLTDKMIDSGRGHELPSETRYKTDPLAKAIQSNWAKRSALRIEVERRYGPGAPSRLPKGFGPIKRNPSPPVTHAVESTYHGLENAPDEFAKAALGLLGETETKLRELYSRVTSKPQEQNPAHSYTLNAYKIKAERGGGFRGVVFNRLTKEKLESPALGTLSEATYWVKKKISDLIPDGAYKLAPMSRKGEYLANVWTETMRNPQPQSQEMYKEFHGKPSTGTLEVHYKEHEHHDLALLGDLCQLKIITIHKKDVVLNCAPGNPPDPSKLAIKDKVLLCSNEEGTQLYFRGGDQSIDLKSIGMLKADIHDLMLIGVCYELTYQTEKSFHKFKLTDYFHALGEDTSVQPVLLYDPLSKLIHIAGGQYHITARGIEN